MPSSNARKARRFASVLDRRTKDDRKVIAALPTDIDPKGQVRSNGKNQRKRSVNSQYIPGTWVKKG